MPPMQAKLLRVLQEQRIKPVGGNEEIEVDVRLVAATHQDLPALVQTGRFREDLYYRLNVVNIVLPPLRERRDDIALLVEHFLHRYGSEHGQVPRTFAPEAMRLLMAYAWPGNVRELANVVERAMVLSTSTVITAESLPESLRKAPPTDPMGAIAFVPLDEMIDHYVARVLEHTGGNHTQAARILGISRRTLHRMEARKRSGTQDSSDTLSHGDQN
jgi:DNA-binding NtrC family response regulator